VKFILGVHFKDIISTNMQLGNDFLLFMYAVTSTHIQGQPMLM